MNHQSPRSHSNRTVILCSSLLICVVGVHAAAQDSKTAKLAGRAVQMLLVRADDLSPVPWPVGNVELGQNSTIVTADKNIYMLLQENGVAPDSGAFALVYDLNTALTDANTLPPNSTVHLPLIESGPELSQLLKNGQLVELTPDPALRAQLNQRIEDLQSSLPFFSQAGLDESMRGKIIRLIGWYQQIEKRFKHKTDPPLRHDTLVQLVDEADLLDSVLRSVSQNNRDGTPSEQNTIAAIYDDVETEMQAYGEVLASTAPKAQAFYAVTVNIRGAAVRTVSGLRVYYTYNGLFRPLPADPPVTSFGFTRLGSGSSENLLMKNYQIWASKDGDPNHPVTVSFALRIDASSPAALSVDLSLTNRGKK